MMLKIGIDGEILIGPFGALFHGRRCIRQIILRNTPIKDKWGIEKSASIVGKSVSMIEKSTSMIEKSVSMTDKQ